RELLVRHGKGGKDRRTLQPRPALALWRDHLQRFKVLADRDRTAGVPGVYLPFAIERKYPKAGVDWGWQWVFPLALLSDDPRDGHPAAASFASQRGEPKHCEGGQSGWGGEARDGT
ncbi:MAG TPA: hypothetical protein PKC45_15490, partial [Gemmatales bacterium]|nr:hypothetical protein [Gemmatales bacterium]